LRANLIGFWTLQSYESSSVNGPDMSYPRTTRATMNSPRLPEVISATAA
jgi:hypothetical protein